jgi:hypothetical protein
MALENWWVVAGKSKGYWFEIHSERGSARREEESKQHTRFGKHWAILGPASIPLVDGRAPSDPPWQRTAFPPRTGLAAPDRWPDAPAGMPPFEFKQAQALASALVAPKITESQRIRDLIAHIREQMHESGAAFVETPRAELSFSEYMRGCRYLENEDIERWRKHDSPWAFIDAPLDDERSNSKTGDHLIQVDDSVMKARRRLGQLSKIADGSKLRGYQKLLARAQKGNAGFEFVHVEYVLAQPALKGGRKPIGANAMTNAERKRRQRKKLRVIVDAPPLSGEVANVPTLDQRAVDCANPARLDHGRGEYADKDTT